MANNFEHTIVTDPITLKQGLLETIKEIVSGAVHACIAQELVRMVAKAVVKFSKTSDKGIYDKA